MFDLVLIPILLGMYGMGWCLFFWFIKVNSPSLQQALAITMFSTIIVLVVYFVTGPRWGTPLVILAVISLAPLILTSALRTGERALRPVPYTAATYCLLMVAGYFAPPA